MNYPVNFIMKSQRNVFKIAIIALDEFNSNKTIIIIAPRH